MLTMKQGGSDRRRRSSGRTASRSPGASVVVDQRAGADHLSRTVTNDSGQFHFGHWLDPERDAAILTISAPGLAAAVRKIVVTPSIPPQTIQLTTHKSTERPRRGLAGEPSGWSPGQLKRRRSRNSVARMERPQRRSRPVRSGLMPRLRARSSSMPTNTASSRHWDAISTPATARSRSRCIVRCTCTAR